MIYLDSAAILKLIRREHESEALLAWLTAQSDKTLVASALVTAEVQRALRRTDSDRPTAVPMVLAKLNRIPIDETILATAATYQDPLLQTSAGIHLASAQALVHEGLPLTAFVTYDRRLLTAAADAGLTTAAPGAE